MKRNTRLILCTLAAVGMAVPCMAQDTPRTPAKPTIIQPEKPKAPGAQPGGPSQEEMMAYMEAATPGPMHAWLAKSTGTWEGKMKMWHGADAPPEESTCTSVLTSMFDGRYIKNETKGEVMFPEGPPFQGFGLTGYDNAAKKFVNVWLDNMGTGLMTGTGDLSADQKTLTITATYHCPIQKKPITMREIERRTGENTFTLEMYGPDAKTGKEFKMMEIAFTRKPGTGPAPSVKPLTPSGAPARR